MRSVVDQSVVMRRIPVQGLGFSKMLALIFQKMWCHVTNTLITMLSCGDTLAA